MSRYVPRGYVDMRDLTGTPGVSAAEAKRRQDAGEVFTRERPPRPGLVPLTAHEVLTAVNEGTFPAPQQLGPGRRYWLRSDVLRWIAENVSARQT